MEASDGQGNLKGKFNAMQVNQMRSNMSIRSASQSGNALFLILIAVALFAALSYAITQSGRGSGSISKEQAKLYAAQIIQTEGEIRAGVQRMVIEGTPASSIIVGDPANTSLPGIGSDNGFPDFCTTGTTCIFAPEGGGITIPQLPKEAFADGGVPSWVNWTAFSGPHSYGGLHLEKTMLYLMLEQLTQTISSRYIP